MWRRLHALINKRLRLPTSGGRRQDIAEPIEATQIVGTGVSARSHWARASESIWARVRRVWMMNGETAARAARDERAARRALDREAREGEPRLARAEGLGERKGAGTRRSKRKLAQQATERGTRACIAGVS